MNRLNTTELKIAIARAYALCKRHSVRAVEVLMRAGIKFFDACRIVSNLQGA